LGMWGLANPGRPVYDACPSLAFCRKLVGFLSCESRVCHEGTAVSEEDL
jgi:hypothetical protein